MHALNSRIAQLSPRGFIGAIVALFCAVGILVYGYSVMTNQFVEFDDTLLITDNLSVIQAGRLSSVLWAFGHYDPELYIPMTFLSFQLDAVIGGLNPVIFHLDNLIEHIINSLLIVWILHMLFRRIDIAIVLGLLFLVHPLNTEAVAWASGRKDLLSTLFFLLSIGTYLRSQHDGDRRWHMASVGAFFLGLLAKVSIAPLPLVLIALDWLQGKRLTARSLWSKKWYFLFAFLFGLIAILGKDQVLERTSTESVILLIPRTTFFYIEKLLLPINLSIFYPFAQSDVAFFNPELLGAAAATLIAAILLWKYRRRYPAVALGTVIGILMLIPSFFQYYRGSELYLASDRYMYGPFVGVLIAMVPALAWCISKWRTWAWTVGIIALFVFGTLSLQRSMVWKNTYTLFSDSLKTKETFLGYEKVGAWLLREGDTAEAVQALQRSVELSPNSAAYFRLGVAAMGVGNTGDAKLFTLKSLELSPENPQAHTNMSKLYWDEGNIAKAIEHAELAVEYHPWSEMALGNLASMYTLTGRNEDALRIINQLLDVYPNHPRAGPLLQKIRGTE